MERISIHSPDPGSPKPNKVELQVVNITNSQAQVGAFAMLLGEVGGERQLPIIIGPAEAQATALYLFYSPAGVCT